MDDMAYTTGYIRGDAYIRNWGLRAGVQAATRHAHKWDRESAAGFVDAVLRIVQAVEG